MTDSSDRCSNCPGSASRGYCKADQLQEIDVLLARNAFDTNPVYELTASADLRERLESEFEVNERDVDPLFLCARKRYLGLCSANLVEVSINTELL